MDIERNIFALLQAALVFIFIMSGTQAQAEAGGPGPKMYIISLHA